MRFEDVPGELQSLRVRRADGNEFDAIKSATANTVPVVAVIPSSRVNVFSIKLPGFLVDISAVNEGRGINLNRALVTGNSYLAHLSDFSNDRTAILSLAFFSGPTIDFGEIEIGVDEYVKQRIEKFQSRTIRDTGAWLQDELSLVHLGEQYCFVVVGPAIQSVLDAESKDEPRLEATPHLEEGEVLEPQIGLSETQLRKSRALIRHDIINSFCLASQNVRCVVTQTEVVVGQPIFVASKFTKVSPQRDRAIRLARVQLRFSDWTNAGGVRLQAQATLASLTKQSTSYLKKWDDFGSIEDKLVLERARRFGCVEYSSPESVRRGGVVVKLENASESALEMLSASLCDDVELVESVPDYLDNLEISIADLTLHELKREEAARLIGVRASRTPAETRSFPVVHFNLETRRLEIEAENLPPQGKLIYSIAGEIAQNRRRLQARKAILDGRSANSQIGIVIDSGDIVSLRSEQRVKPLTAFVRSKVFSNPPTSKQELAIDIALNTPDIAVIQGPPGTGKTTVIAAIVERLNEIAAMSGQHQAGQILLSGFQHDAVENLIDRLSINGLPVPKFGNRNSANSDSDAEHNLITWCKQLSERLRATNPDLAEVEEERGVRDSIEQYLRAPTRALAQQLLTRVVGLGMETLGDELWRVSNALLSQAKLDKSSRSARERQLLAVRRIRSGRASFSDDGPARAGEALSELEELLDEPQMALLQKATSWLPSRGTPPFLDEIRGFKRELLLRFTQPPEFRVEKHNDEIVSVSNAALSAVRQRGQSSKNSEAAVLAEFLAELESNPSGMMDAVSTFSFAFSATIQGSLRPELRQRKGLMDGVRDQILDYGYVILDEAARISPRDLMIGLAQGRKVILVGDHRQLPHIIDQEVERRMEAGESGDGESEWLKKSAFEYLFNERIAELEKTDHIQRRVTLDQQFRMHPILGDFVSRNFYERFNPAERFTSGLPPEYFRHDLPGTNGRAAMWIDVPGSVGLATRSGTSWTREAEAEVISRQLAEWLNSTQGAGLTFGVISFYKAQAERIASRLRNVIGDEPFEARRVRVGTVDSFQGMEFDVAFLSVVRTMTNSLGVDIPSERNARRAFGHLCLYNRLNVSMSRQKKLLVVVGDPALVNNKLAAEYIPGLVDFRRLAN